jgi:hypothetical protein
MRVRPLCLALALCALPAAAQEPARAPATVQILGLRNWTAKMLEDSVTRYAPGTRLAENACAVILRDSVGFADAGVIRLGAGGRSWAILKVVEPELRDRVRFRTYAATRPAVEEWAELFALLREHRDAMNPLQHPEVLLGGSDTAYGQPVSEPARRLRTLLRGHATPRDWELARAAILSDSSPTNRTVAALVLSNFGARDSTFHLLAEGMRATDMGAATAGMVLSALARHQPRAVDWAPARDALDALVGGTNLFGYTHVLDALAATRIDPSLGRALAQRNPGLLLDHLSSQDPVSPGPAHRFLAHVSGRDFGRDRAAWERWLAD